MFASVFSADVQTVAVVVCSISTVGADGVLTEVSSTNSGSCPLALMHGNTDVDRK